MIVLNIAEAKIQLAKALIRDYDFLSKEEQEMMYMLANDPDVRRWMKRVKDKQKEMENEANIPKRSNLQ